MKPRIWLFLPFLALTVLAQMPTPNLAPCPSSPNCVSSKETNPDKQVASINLRPEQDWAQIKTAVSALGGEILMDQPPYLKAVFTSTIFRFKDDLELLQVGQTLELRSASRVGFWDMG